MKIIGYLSSRLSNIILMGFSITCLSQAAASAELTVNVSGLKQGQGHLMVALYTDAASYKSNTASQYAKVKVAGEQELVVFEALASGDYAIKMYQDENDNNKFDYNITGFIPKEAYGFSNNKGRFGEPSYEKSRFTVDGDTSISITLF
ncbi:DUF2141 domain-containing protein [Agaribacterium sp. ZY112]|uniref:DUF2141 domain-containing protein n=1 Tax=Agaribacterium sp. ZY112 TaxID=3233574 RepID=UPI003524CE42